MSPMVDLLLRLDARLSALEPRLLPTSRRSRSAPSSEAALGEPSDDERANRVQAYLRSAREDTHSLGLPRRPKNR